MANSENCPSPPGGQQARPQWKAGSYLSADGCQLEQSYRLQRLRRRNRELHGWGVLCGLWVVPAANGPDPWEVQICPGYAIGPYGDELEVFQPIQVNVEDYLWFRPDPIAGIAVVPVPACVAIRYQDWMDCLTLVPNPPCSCDDPSYRNARTADGYQPGVIWAQPAKAGQPQELESLCGAGILDCPPCPPSPWVVLASINLPPRGVPITAAMIDNGIRTSL